MAEKLTPEEIKKALECCKPDNDEGCLNCPFDKYSSPDCAEMLFKESVDLINRQQEEIERLNVDLVGMRGACNSYKMHYDNAKAEIERLQEELKTKNGLVLEVFENKSAWERVARIKGIKEFAERLKNLIRFSNQPDRYYIDNLVKEMVGDV